MVQFNLKNFI